MFDHEDFVEDGGIPSEEYQLKRMLVAMEREYAARSRPIMQRLMEVEASKNYTPNIIDYTTLQDGPLRKYLLG